MDSVDKLMAAAVLCFMAAFAAYEHGMICVPVSLLIIAAACVIAAVRRSIKGGIMKNPIKITLELNEIRISGDREQIGDLWQRLIEFSEKVNGGQAVDMENGTIRLTGSNEVLYLILYFLSGRGFNAHIGD